MSQEQTDMTLPGDASETAAPAEGPAAPDAAALLREIDEWKQKAAAGEDLAMRARADMDNLRKRTARDIEAAHKYALERFVIELLPVLDSVELGIAASQGAADAAALRQGMDLTLKMFGDALQKFGVTALNPLGEKFNPERHQAVSTREQPGAEPGTVIAVMQKGYDLNGRVVRPAMVVVAT